MPMRTVLHVLAAAGAGAALLACSEPIQPVACPGDSVTLTIASSASAPLISWAPTCAMGLIQVNQADGGAMWEIDTVDSNRVLPPVRYGEVPPGMQEMSALHPLVPGETYTVSVWRWLSSEPGAPNFRRAGVTTFQR